MKKATTILLLICVATFAQQKSTFTDPRDNKTYKTAKIGEQVWMAEKRKKQPAQCPLRKRPSNTRNQNGNFPFYILKSF